MMGFPSPAVVDADWSFALEASKFEMVNSPSSTSEPASVSSRFTLSTLE